MVAIAALWSTDITTVQSPAFRPIFRTIQLNLRNELDAYWHISGASRAKNWAHLWNADIFNCFHCYFIVIIRKLLPIKSSLNVHIQLIRKWVHTFVVLWKYWIHFRWYIHADIEQSKPYEFHELHLSFCWSLQVCPS